MPTQFQAVGILNVGSYRSDLEEVLESGAVNFDFTLMYGRARKIHKNTEPKVNLCGS